MKKLLIIIFGFSLVTCTPHENTNNQTTQENPKFKGETVVSYANTPRGISIQVIDDCQYIYCETTSGVAIIHKANCNNSIHEK